ncbi:MAG: RluA family pseudouridine synthase [Aerococcus sp.]|nr:RluA family pseudouridine synthase [Aerococcus sp.]
MRETLRVTESIGNQRLDQWLVEQTTGYSRSQLKKGIKEGWITVNEQLVKPSYPLAMGDVVDIDSPVTTEEEKQVIPEAKPLAVVYEDEDIMVINKPQGLVVHPAEGHQNGTLVNRLVAYAHQNSFTLPEGSAWYRPGIVHRLDKDTSGLMVVAKTARAYQALVHQFQSHAIHRGYRGLCYGEWEDDEGVIDAPIGRDPNHRTRFMVLADGQRAVTHFKRVAWYDGYTLVDFELETGRTHQIRVHTAFVNHPIADDPLYAPNYKGRFFSKTGQLLHAQTLRLEHPISGEDLHFSVPLPNHFQRILENLE